MYLVGMARCSKWGVDIFNNFTIYVFFGLRDGCSRRALRHTQHTEIRSFKIGSGLLR